MVMKPYRQSTSGLETPTCVKEILSRATRMTGVRILVESGLKP